MASTMEAAVSTVVGASRWMVVASTSWLGVRRPGLFLGRMPEAAPRAGLDLDLGRELTLGLLGSEASDALGLRRCSSSAVASRPSFSVMTRSRSVMLRSRFCASVSRRSSWSSRRASCSSCCRMRRSTP
jgi:hypothetical protein